MKKVLVLDLDGTLLNSNKELDKETIQSVYQVSPVFREVIIASGRGHDSIKKIYQQLGIKGYIVAQNGSYAMDHDERLLYYDPIPYDTLEKAFQIAYTERLNSFFTGIAQGIYFEPGNQFKSTEGIQTVTDFSHYISDNRLTFAKFSFDVTRFTKMKQQIIREMLEELSLTVALSDLGHFEVTNPGVSKLKGVSAVVNELGFNLSEVLAIGDSENDLELLENVGLSVAMGNATSPVKQIVTTTTASNDELGVARFLLNYVKKGSYNDGTIT